MEKPPKCWPRISRAAGVAICPSFYGRLFPRHGRVPPRGPQFRRGKHDISSIFRFPHSPRQMRGLPFGCMPHTGNVTVDIILYSIAGVVLLVIGYQVGRWFATMSFTKLVNQKEQELFTAQKG